MKVIDLEHYPRRSHFEFFSTMAFPYVGLTANVDVTNLVVFAKAQGESPFLACLWAAANAANGVPELRQRVVDGKIVELEHCDTAHTVAMPDHTFTNCQTDCRRELADFLRYGRDCQDQARQKAGFVSADADETALMFVSCVPWLQFTQCIQPAPIPADYNPRIVFGKFFEQEGRLMMPLHIQCNHALVDGWHISEFFRLFQVFADSKI